MSVKYRNYWENLRKFKNGNDFYHFSEIIVLRLSLHLKNF